MRWTPMFWVPLVILGLVTSLAAAIWTTSLPKAFAARRAEVAAVPRDAPRLLT